MHYIPVIGWEAPLDVTLVKEFSCNSDKKARQKLKRLKEQPGVYLASLERIDRRTWKATRIG